MLKKIAYDQFTLRMVLASSAQRLRLRLTGREHSSSFTTNCNQSSCEFIGHSAPILSGSSILTFYSVLHTLICPSSPPVTIMRY